MKNLLTFVLLLIFSVNIRGKKEVTKFLGMPVDGTKTEMIQKLKAKGFKSSIHNRDVLEGEFNGVEVSISVATNNNKVFRIVIVDKYARDETDIKIRFNTLCRQFKNNAKYYSLGDFELSDDEDISYEIPINNKRYDAVYYQKNTANPEETIEEASMRSVWFMIHSEYGKYRIVMFYDNEYNHAQGEDL